MSLLSLFAVELTLLVISLIAFIVFVKGLLGYLQGCTELIAYYCRPKLNKEIDYKHTLKTSKRTILLSLFFIALPLIIYYTIKQMV